MDERRFTIAVKELVVDYINGSLDATDEINKITVDNVFIVWMSKILQNNKALASTTLPNGMYFEITYNGDKNEIYLDAYKKWQNILIEIEEEPQDT